MTLVLQVVRFNALLNMILNVIQATIAMTATGIGYFHQKPTTWSIVLWLTPHLLIGAFILLVTKKMYHNPEIMLDPDFPEEWQDDLVYIAIITSYPWMFLVEIELVHSIFFDDYGHVFKCTFSLLVLVFLGLLISVWVVLTARINLAGDRHAADRTSIPQWLIVPYACALLIEDAVLYILHYNTELLWDILDHAEWLEDYVSISLKQRRWLPVFQLTSSMGLEQ